MKLKPIYVIYLIGLITNSSTIEAIKFKIIKTLQ